MLDQNTDRMWYVIGAVIIGAAIIFILNGTMPDLFASVGGTFTNKTEQVTNDINELSMADGIDSVQRKNKVVNGEVEKSVLNLAMTEYDDKGVATEQYIYYDLSEILNPSTQYTFSFDYKSTANIASIEAFFLGHTPENTRRVLKNTNGEWIHESYTFMTHDPTVNPTTPWWTGNKVRFDNNFSKTKEPSILWVKDVSVIEVIKTK